MVGDCVLHEEEGGRIRRNYNNVRKTTVSIRLHEIGIISYILECMCVVCDRYEGLYHQKQSY